MRLKKEGITEVYHPGRPKQEGITGGLPPREAKAGGIP